MSVDLELERAAGDRRLYVLVGVGRLRVGRFASRTATAEAGGRRWQFGRRGFWQRVIEATDESGEVVGRFAPRELRGGGTLHWADRELAVRRASLWRERYALAEDGRELAILDGKSWGRKPVRITVEDLESLEPGLVLFAAFVVRGLAADSGVAATTGGDAATSGG